jgi:hypothetical protein
VADMAKEAKKQQKYEVLVLYAIEMEVGMGD